MNDPIGSFFQQQLALDSKKTFNRSVNAARVENTLRNAVIEFLRSENWQYTVTENPAILRMMCQGKNGQWRCYAQIKENERQFIFYSVCPIATPTEKLKAIAEYIARANYGMAIGNFELDFKDGEIRFRTSMQAQDNQLSLDSIEHLVYTNAAMMDRYLPGIIAVTEDIEPKEAIKAIEFKSKPHLS